MTPGAGVAHVEGLSKAERLNQFGAVHICCGGRAELNASSLPDA